VVEQSSLSEETGGEVRKLSACFPLLCGEWACPLTTEYPFIKHIPIAIVMSISHISGCATICGKQKQRDYTYFDYTVFGFLISGKER